MNDSRMSPEDVARLGDAALACINQQQWGAARDHLELLFAMNVYIEAMVVAYAVCLSELGEGERGLQIYEALRARDGSIAMQDLVAEAGAFMPGGKQHKDKREALKDSAERWLPRLTKPHR